MNGWISAIPWLALVVTGIAVLRARREAKQAALQSEKLKLEIQSLRNSPEVVADRRALYERFRSVVNEIFRELQVQDEHLFELFAIHHDAQFQFPTDVTDEIQDRIRNILQLQLAQALMEHARPAVSLNDQTPEGVAAREEWRVLCAREREQVDTFLEYMESMVEVFKPHLER